jgi:hypothetical protein
MAQRCPYHPGVSRSDDISAQRHRELESRISAGISACLQCSAGKDDLKGSCTAAATDETFPVLNCSEVVANTFSDIKISAVWCLRPF